MIEMLDEVNMFRGVGVIVHSFHLFEGVEICLFKHIDICPVKLVHIECRMQLCDLGRNDNVSASN